MNPLVFAHADNEDENRKPDFSNYNFLFHLYGLVPGADPYDPPTAAPTVSPAPSLAPTIELVGTSQKVDPDESEGGNNGADGNGNRSLEGSADTQALLVDARERIMSGSTNGVRLLHRGVHGEVHEAEMANGHKLRLHKLLPVE